MILTRADLGRYEASQNACWVQDIHRSRVVWANKAALTVLNAASHEELYAREVKPLSKAAHTRLWTYLGRVSGGKELTTQWTSFPTGKPVTFLAKVHAFHIEDGHLALFFDARDIRDSVCPEGLRMLEASRHSMASYALYGLNGQLLERNAAFLREFGEDGGKQGDHFLEMFADRAEGERIRTVVVSAGEFRGRVKLVARGDTRWHLLLALSILDPVDGHRVIHLEAFDINDQVEAELRAREAELLLQQIADEFPHPVAYTDMTRTYRFVNKTYANWLGRAPDAIIGHTVGEMTSPEVNAIWDAYWPKLAKGERAHYERRANYVGHGERWIRVDVVPHQHATTSELTGMFVFGYDIQSEKLAEAGRKISERQLELIANSLPVGVCIFDADWRARFANPPFFEWFSQNRTTMIGRHVEEIYGAEAFDEILPMLERARDGEVVQMRRVGNTQAGAKHWLDITLAPFDDGHDNRHGITAVFADVTKRVEANEALNRTRNALASHLANTPLAVIQLDENRRVTQWTGRAGETFGWSSTEATGHSIEELKLFDEEGRSRFEHELQWLDQGASDRFTASCRNLRKDGIALHTEWYGSVLREESLGGGKGKVTSYLLLVQDVSARVSAEKHLHYVANHDVLTGLANRAQFQERLKSEIGRAKRLQHALAVVLVDLDRFKYVNESLGHGTGDTLLQQVALRFGEAIGSSDLIARTGGDEFMLLVDLENDESRAHVIAERLRVLLTRPFKVVEQEMFVTASIGVSIFPYDADNDADLVKNADWAMYRAKDAGRNGVQYYSHALASDVPMRLSLDAELRRAVELNQLELHYQPKQSLVTRAITGAEALLRWRHPERGLVPPDEFISLAEESGLINDLGEWVIRAACKQIADWRLHYTNVPQIAINLSALQLKRRDLAQEILAELGKYKLPGSALMVEVTETGVISDPMLATISLEVLRDHGVHAAIDDFGKGFSSLTQLKRLPIDALKIDGSFVRDVVIDRDDAAIVQAIIGLARNLDMHVIAEGVETQEQMAFLMKHGCDEAQGYLIARPLPAEDFAARFLQKATT
jgi:diguanylate cyclase (GGDEF)-like protein/PAS domain S-box-containing protein